MTTRAATGPARPGTGDKGTISLSGQNFGEMQIMAAMYQQVLENAGYKVDVKLVDTRDVYEPQLESGDVDVAPDYLAGMADFLNTKANGANAPSITTNSPQETLAALKPLADGGGHHDARPGRGDRPERVRRHEGLRRRRTA